MSISENEIAEIVLDKAFKIHRKLGAGLLESVYERLLCYELQKEGLLVQSQVPITIMYDDLEIDNAFRADLVVNNKVILEIKSLERINNAHKKQLLTYLKLSGLKLGLLLNFGSSLLKNGIVRTVNNLPEN